MNHGASSLAKRVSVIGVVTLALVLLAVTGAVSFMLTRVAHERVVSWAGDKAESLVEAMHAMDDTSRVLVERNFGSFRQEFGPSFTLDESTGDLRDWGPKLNGNTTQVDKFTANTGGVATVFAAKGDDFERITTSLKNAKGERVVGTLMGKQHPAYPSVSAGKPYSGRAVLLGRPYMTHYEPIKNDAGKLIGLLFVGFELDAFEAAMSTMANNAKFFESGGVYVVAMKAGPAEATFVSHPSLKGKLVREAFPGFEKTLAELTDSSEGYVADAPNVLGSARNDNFAVIRKSDRTGYWVVAQISRGESMASHWATMLPFWMMLALTTVGLGFGLFWVMRNWVAKPMQDLTRAVGAIAQGDLTHAVSSTRNDEIGVLIQQTEAMRQRLASTIGVVRQSVDSIGTASNEIASGNMDLSQRTETTAGSLQVAASSMNELSSTVKQTADAAQAANQLVTAAADAAAKGGQVVGQVVATMEDINTSSRKINDIIGVIDGIAFQTNILALNAAVEAARAGEQGRGFAVVASEVRSLAQRSAEAAKEIKTLIGASVDRVELGSRLVQEAGTSMTDIVGSVQRVQSVISEITLRSADQSEGLTQINQSVVDLDQMTQQNAALVEESAAAATSLKDQAQRLVEAVAVFRLQDDALSGIRAPRAAQAASSQPTTSTTSTATASFAAKRPAVASHNKASTAVSAKGISKPMAAAKPVASPSTNDSDWETF
ncbi:methyl-accepting chemotaxis protein [Roseateles koreensis]|uniref:Methyl-accepting chemotaxis protein n=1 Tax=Roseateles koreensis TaxID=2987526 RepID=A0ABT5KMB6_9BURK|nr:methyl-accepting chemotaxis protein [Roseateles koreensis]MDC8783625.1 methyl-accepting chemotaxis protein [Roseateles koreensis]